MMFLLCFNYYINLINNKVNYYTNYNLKYIFYNMLTNLFNSYKLRHLIIFNLFIKKIIRL